MIVGDVILENGDNVFDNRGGTVSGALTTGVETTPSSQQPGRYSDGGGLYLYVSSDLNKSWVFRWVRDGKRREMGLGAYRDVSVAQA